MVIVENPPAPPTATPRRRPAAAQPNQRTFSLPTPPAPTGDDEMAGLVTAAAAGDQMAWQALTRRFGGMIMAIARSCRLSEPDTAEVHQLTWLRLVEHIDRIEQPERVGAWLATTAKRESLRIVRTKGRLSFDYDGLLRRPDTDAAPPDAKPIATERADAVRRAMALLPPHCRRLLEILVDDDPPSYRQVSEILAMPIGSIGPTRGRCLSHLRKIMVEMGIDG